MKVSQLLEPALLWQGKDSLSHLRVQPCLLERNVKLEEHNLFFRFFNRSPRFQLESK